MLAVSKMAYCIPSMCTSFQREQNALHPQGIMFVCFDLTRVFLKDWCKGHTIVSLFLNSSVCAAEASTLFLNSIGSEQLIQRTFFENTERQMNKPLPPGANIAIAANSRHHKKLGGKAREIWETGVLKSSPVNWRTSKSTHSGWSSGSAQVGREDKEGIVNDLPKHWKSYCNPELIWKDLKSYFPFLSLKKKNIQDVQFSTKNYEACKERSKYGPFTEGEKEDVNKETEMIKRNQIGIPELERKTTEMKNPLEVSIADLSRQRKESRIGQMTFSSLRVERKKIWRKMNRA